MDLENEHSTSIRTDVQKDSLVNGFEQEQLFHGQVIDKLQCDHEVQHESEVQVGQVAQHNGEFQYFESEIHYQPMHPLMYYDETNVASHQIIGTQNDGQQWPRCDPEDDDQKQYVQMTMIPFGDTSADLQDSEQSTNLDPKQSTNRELHNQIERRRRMRIKQCCDELRLLVPGISDKTDKATVLECTVKFVGHLVKCPGLMCKCGQPE